MHLIEKWGAFNKSLSEDILGLGEVGSFNLAKICSISGAMHECSCASVHMSMNMNFRKWCIFQVAIYLVISKLGPIIL